MLYPMGPIETLTDSTNGIIVYVTMLLAAVYLIATNVEKIGGVFYSFAEKRREAATLKTASEITSMRRQLNYLVGAVQSLEEALIAEREVNVRFERWAYDVRRVAAAAGIALPEPPHPLETKPLEDPPE